MVKRSGIRNKIGGRYIGRGRDGCVYGRWNDTDALRKITGKCISVSGVDEVKVSERSGVKILDKFDAIDEWKSIRLIQKTIPDYKKWFYIPNQLCTVNKIHDEDHVNNNCHFKVGKNTYGLILPLGDANGLDVNIPMKNLLISFKNLFDAVKKLSENGIIHNDLKEGNVVYSNGNMFLIDFGHMSTYTEGGWRKATPGNIMTYHAWPFDWYLGTVLYDIQKNLSNGRWVDGPLHRMNIQQLINMIVSNGHDFSFNKKWDIFVKRFANSNRKSPTNRGIRITKSMLSDWYKSVEEDFKIGLGEYRSLSMRKLDVWSVAKCCGAIFDRLYYDVNGPMIDDFREIIDRCLDASVISRPDSTKLCKMYDMFLSKWIKNI